MFNAYNKEIYREMLRLLKELPSMHQMCGVGENMVCPSCGYPLPNRIAESCGYCEIYPEVRGEEGMKKLDQKYLVLKREDIGEALSEVEQQVLQQLCQRIAWYRQGQGKAENQYLVLNIDD